MGVQEADLRICPWSFDCHFESDSCDVAHERDAHHVKSPVQAVEYADS